MNPLKTIPSHIEYNDYIFTIQWMDGKTCQYELLALRKACPCAECRGGHSPDSVRTTDHIQEIELASYKKIGRYAIQFTWSDHHDAGIYTYDMLREACDDKICNECKDKDRIREAKARIKNNVS